MMANANENPNGDPFSIDGFHCGVASRTRRKVLGYFESQQEAESDSYSAV